MLRYMYISNLVQNSVCIYCLSHAFCLFILLDVIPLYLVKCTNYKIPVYFHPPSTCPHPCPLSLRGQNIFTSVEDYYSN